MFDDRSDAGRKLAEQLERYRDSDAIVLAIPCGGAEVGFQVATALDLEFDLIITRKLPMPNNPESGIGAVAEDGSSIMAPETRGLFDEETIVIEIMRQRR